MPEKHPGATIIGSKPQDGDRSPLLANPENPARGKKEGIRRGKLGSRPS